MRFRVYLLWMLAVLALSAVSFAQDAKQSSPENQVVEIDKRWWNGWATKDIKSLEEIADDNYIEFTGRSSKRAEGKTKFIGDCQSLDAFSGG